MSSRSEPRSASYLLLSGVYLLALIGGIVLILGIDFVAETYFNATFSNNAMGLILMAVAAMSTGSYWFSREHAVPSSGRKWTLAVILTVLTVGLQSLIVYSASSVAGELQQLSREFAGPDRALMLSVVAVLVVIELLMIRASIWQGLRSSAKREAQRG